jgi:plastocyanin
MGFTWGRETRQTFNRSAVQPAHRSRWFVSGTLAVLLLTATACGSGEASSPTSARAHTGTRSAHSPRGKPASRTTTASGASGKGTKRTGLTKSSVTSTTKPASTTPSRPTVSQHASTRVAAVKPTPTPSTSPTPTSTTGSTTVATPPTSSPTTVAPVTTTTTVPKLARLAIRNFAFLPSPLIISAGTTVAVTNDDTVAHTWTSDTGLFNSGDIAPGSSYRFTFTKPGTYSYHCSIHPFMTGTITVEGTSP